MGHHNPIQYQESIPLKKANFHDLSWSNSCVSPTNQDQIFHNKEEIEAEVNRRVEEEKLKLEQVEREKSIERRKRIVIIREDLEKKQAEEDRQRMLQELERLEVEQIERETANREEHERLQR